MTAERVNASVAGRLDEVARLLDEQGANPFRARAYRRAAETLRALPQPVSEILAAKGLPGLDELPGIGESLARSIREIVLRGRLPMLDRLRGESDPEALLRSVPGVGPALAARLHGELGIETLEELEAAAQDGRLAALSGVGAKRLAGIRDSLAHRLDRVRPRAVRDAGGPIEAGPGSADAHDEPPVAELLDVDREYRERAAAGTLRKIAPRRMNPTGEAWLPVLHAHRGERHYTALFSNTPRAHELGRTRDWVVLYYDGGRGERQCTVITAERGGLRGRRIVRGREGECEEFHGGGGGGGGTL